MELQQLEVKLFTDGDLDDVDHGLELIPIFHRWIRESRLGDVLLIDVADYRHVPNGPGVMLIGDGVQWKLDSGGGELGLVFARKRDAIGPAETKLGEAFDRLLVAVEALEAEPALRGRLRFRRDHGLITVMSRLVATNDEATYDQLAAEIARFWAARFPGEISLERASSDPREPLSVRFRVASR